MNTEVAKINTNNGPGHNKTNRLLVISLATAMFGGLTACERKDSNPLCKIQSQIHIIHNETARAGT